MNWYKQINDYIDANLISFINHFFPSAVIDKISNSYRVNPSPCCGHNDAFSFASNINAANCYSCGISGNRISYLKEVLGEEVALDELENWSGIKRSVGDKSEDKISKEEERLNQIYDFAVDFYCNQLVFGDSDESKEARAMQLSTDLDKGGRGHNVETLIDFKVGLSLDNYNELIKGLLAKGYTHEEIEKARPLIWIPPNYFTYPYFQAGKLKRINCKAYKQRCRGTRSRLDRSQYNDDCLTEFYSYQKEEIKIHEEENMHKFTKKQFSTGSRSGIFFGKKNSSRKVPKTLILVEGDDDALSVHENLTSTNPNYEREYVVKALGGNPSEDSFKSSEIKYFDNIFTMFDNDDVGRSYTKRVNTEIADAKVYKIVYPTAYDDPDFMFKTLLPSDLDEQDLNMETLINKAEILETDQVVVSKISKDHIWLAKNRSFEMTFNIERYNKRTSQFEGLLIVKQGDRMVNRVSGSLDKVRVSKIFEPAKFNLSDELIRYYHNVPWGEVEPAREFIDLVDIITLTKQPNIVIKQIAWYLYNSEQDLYNEKYKYAVSIIRDDVTISKILKEVNGFSNSEFNPDLVTPRITLTQYFNIANNDAYFYFSRKVQDGDTVKLVPFLINNRKEETRLDLIKRKDPQSLLLIDNKYELSFAIETAPLDPSEVSLQPYWVDKWKNDEVTDEEIDPKRLIDEIDSFITKVFYTQESTRKVLALWILATYYHMLFRSGFPYLMLNGPKGSGKSTFDLVVYLLSLNAKMALDISPAAMYRMITSEGGTFILDEIENLSDKKSADNSDFAKILKGGYSDSAYIYRTNMEKGGITEKFSAFGPKVISNINGLDDVIADRCIVIRTFRTPTSKTKYLEKSQVYKEERREEVHSITSRCVLSALKYFKKVDEIHNSNESYLDTGNARLSQIIQPLMTIAHLVGGDYKKHLLKFYDQEVEVVKEEITSGTVEGMVQEVLKRVAQEFTGFYESEELWATNKNKHAYDKEIKFSEKEGIFEIDSLHVKVLVESLNGGETVDLKEINSTIKTLLGPTFNLKQNRKQTTATINNEELRRRLNSSRTIKVYKYFLFASDFCDAPRPNVELF